MYISLINLLKSLQNVQFKFSAQHDCRMACCQPSALRPQMQERQETCRTISLIAHEDDGHFILNLHALHNASIIRKFLPRHLTAPRPLYANRTARHYEIARGLRVTQAEKRARTAAKTKATKEANKAKKQKPPTTVTEDTDSEPDADEKESEEEMDAGAAEQVGRSTNKRQRHES